jgi:hypothetical protein
VPWFRAFPGKRLAGGSTTPSGDNFDLLVETSASASAAGRVFRIVMVLAPPSAGACRAGSVILTAELIAGHVQRAADGIPGRDDPGAAGVLDLDAGPEMGISLRSSSVPDPGRRHARVRRGGADGRGPGRQGAGGCDCPERPSPCSGITLSDEGRQGERARNRRSNRTTR